MTRKDYQLIAEALEANKPNDYSPGPQDNTKGKNVMWHDIAKTISDRLKANNPRFNSTLFCLACGGI